MKWKPPHDRYFLWMAIGIVIGWFILTILLTQKAYVISSGDGQRDSAIVMNILGGNILGDPAYKGERAWYPWLMHLYYAGINLLTQ
ncbi:hypothetical protein HY087_02485, partial [Candidatus Gottesmanbacteria bacterium]|nr:hypothetical protein [Candidatus Gottesmanbacteria bacterium]